MNVPKIHSLWYDSRRGTVRMVDGLEVTPEGQVTGVLFDGKVVRDWPAHYAQAEIVRGVVTAADPHTGEIVVGQGVVRGRASLPVIADET